MQAGISALWHDPSAFSNCHSSALLSDCFKPPPASDLQLFLLLPSHQMVISDPSQRNEGPSGFGILSVNACSHLSFVLLPFSGVYPTSRLLRDLPARWSSFLLPCNEKRPASTLLFLPSTTFLLIFTANFLKKSCLPTSSPTLIHCTAWPRFHSSVKLPLTASVTPILW